MPQLNEPSVCAIMLTCNRPAMAQRAVECFRRQTYANKRLLILDTGRPHFPPQDPDGTMVHDWRLSMAAATIGELRNFANRTERADIICHWDDDDWSHTSRISEQVSLLQAAGAEAVGYNEMLFWRAGAPLPEDLREEYRAGVSCEPPFAGEAWLYSNRKPGYCLGTSLCYKRTAWEKRPFEPLHDGEDTQWLAGVKSVGISAYAPPYGMEVDSAPRMVALIHAGNTSPWYKPELLRASEKQGGEWKRVPAWDAYCRGIFA